MVLFSVNNILHADLKLITKFCNRSLKSFFFFFFFFLKEQRMAEGGECGYGCASSNNDVSKRGGCYKSKFVQHLREVRNIIRVVGG